MAWGTPASLGVASGSSAHSVTLSGVSVSVGDLIIVCIAYRAKAYTDAILVSDSAGNSYTVHKQQYQTTNVFGVAVAYAVATSALSSGSITVSDTASGSNNFNNTVFAAYSVSGGATSSPEDTSVLVSTIGGGQFGSGMNLTSGTPTQAGDLLFGLFNSTGLTSFTESPSWTTLVDRQPGTSFNNTNVSASYYVNSGSGAVTWNPTSGGSGAYVPIIIGFKIAPAGGSGVTGTLDADETGSDTASASGSVSWPANTGALAATEAGSDAASIAGGVLVSGGLDAAETGADLAAISAAVVIIGSLDTTETGPDTAAASGVILVAGIFDATETGADTASASGGVAVTGIADAAEVGSDTLAADGTIPVTGALASSETGSDTAHFFGASEITGTLDATETGSDTFHAGGGAVATGSLDASESGSDTAGIAGSVIVGGAMVSVEAANDNAAISGAVLITGTLAASEYGSDDFASSGVVIVSGAFAATESGADIFAGRSVQLVTPNIRIAYAVGVRRRVSAIGALRIARATKANRRVAA